MNQRWTEGRDSYRPPNEVIDTRAHEVVELHDDATPKAFVTAHHYSRTYPAARFRFGLYRRGALVGVAVFSHPCNDRVLTNLFPGPAIASVELGRFVLLDEVPGNGETWFLARCFEALRSRVVGVVSFSDPVPRSRLDGTEIFPGHIGTIYQAHNARYLGRGEGGRVLLLPDGRVLPKRSVNKVRKGRDELGRFPRGAGPVIRALEENGADALSDGDPGAWLERWLPRLTRALVHPGNHKYAWAIARGARKALPASLAYPKKGVVHA